MARTVAIGLQNFETVRMRNVFYVDKTDFNWIIEVISPPSKRMDRSIKLFKYRSAGVREYWMIDHAKNTVTVYFFEEDFVEDYTLTDTVSAHIYDDMKIDFSKLDFS